MKDIAREGVYVRANGWSKGRERLRQAAFMAKQKEVFLAGEPREAISPLARKAYAVSGKRLSCHLAVVPIDEAISTAELNAIPSAPKRRTHMAIREVRVLSAKRGKVSMPRLCGVRGFGKDAYCRCLTTCQPV